MTTLGNPTLPIRMPPEVKARFVAAAYNEGTTAAELIRGFIAWWMGEPGAQLPTRPPTEDDVLAAARDLDPEDQSPEARQLRQQARTVLNGMEAKLDQLGAALRAKRNQAAD